MMPKRNRFALIAFAIVVAFAGTLWAWREYQKVCCGPEEEPGSPIGGARLSLGLMTSLPLIWPIEADVTSIASGSSRMQWQAAAIPQHYEIVPLDTLSAIGGPSPADPEVDPLSDIDDLAVIQPRGLSPADNVALDDWVRGGGQLLLVLDPLLTGHYDLPLADPRRPAGVALIPPIIERWGLEVTFDAQQAPSRLVQWGNGDLELAMAGNIIVAERVQDRCESGAEGALVRCLVGKGRVTFFVDASIFEGDEPSEAKVEAIQMLMRYAWQ